MQYQGGKTRVARDIAEIILANRGDRQTYVEPFLGGAAVFSRVAPSFPNAIGYDAMPDVVEMWRAAINGWVPPSTVTEDEYRAARNWAEPSALRGFIGFPCSFGGKWFGGYARDPKQGRNFADVASRSVVKLADTFNHATIACRDYREISPLAHPGSVIYADPPYSGTLAYAGAGAFDSSAFWYHAQKWAEQGAQVYVSEYTGPPASSFPTGWEPIWEKQTQVSISRDKTVPRATERLWVYNR